MNPGAYSFQDVYMSITGPGGIIKLGYGSGSAEEGITIEALSEIDRMSIGADGSAMHSLVANFASRVVVRLQKTSPTNAQLDAMLRYQRSSSLFWGKNVVVLTNPVSGDVYSGRQGAFGKVPNNAWATEGRDLEWELNIGILQPVIGSNLI